MNPIATSMPHHFHGKQYTYTNLGLLGAGQTATVYRVRPEGTDQEYALKLLSAEEYATRFFAEADKLALLMGNSRELTNPNGQPLIPNVIESHRTGTDQFIVMTLAFGKPLDQIQREEGRLPEKEALTILSTVAQLFDILHTKLHRSYLDFQPRNIYWEAESKSLLVLDWNLLSDEGKADVATDIGALGALLYRLVVGVQPPANGLSAAPEWQQVTPTTQAILRKATHGDPIQRYTSAWAFGDACAQQQGLWNDPVAQLVQKVEETKEILPRFDPAAKERLSDDQMGVIVEARNLMWILDQRRTELGTSYAMRFDSLKEELQPFFDRYGSVLEQGIRFLDIQDRTGAAERFRQAMQETSDPQERLNAARWLLVTEITNDAARTQALAACQALVVNQPEQALTHLTEEVSRQGRESAQRLRQDAQAQILWRQTEDRQKRAAQFGQMREMEAVLSSLNELEEILRLFPTDYRSLLSHRWGDIGQAISALREQIHKRQTKESQFNQLQKEARTLSAAQLKERLKSEFASSPRNPQLVAIALDTAQDEIGRLGKEKGADALLSRMDPIRELLALALAEGFESPLREAIRKEWESTSALKELLGLLGTPYFHREKIEDLFEKIEDLKSQETRQPLLGLMAEVVMAQAKAQDSQEVARTALEMAQKYAPSLTQSIGAEYNTLINERASREQERHKQESQQWDKFVRDIGHLRLSGSKQDNIRAGELLEKAQLLIGKEDSTRRQWLEQAKREVLEEFTQIIRNEELQKIRQDLQKRFDAQKEQLRVVNTADAAHTIASAMPALADEARNRNLPDLALEIEQTQARALALAQQRDKEEKSLQEARAAYDAYKSFPAKDPDYRTVRLAKLGRARALLAPLAPGQEGMHSKAFADLWRAIDDAWRTEGGEYDPDNPDNPLIAQIAALDSQVQKAIAPPRPQPSVVHPPQTPGWLAWVTVAILVILLVFWGMSLLALLPSARQTATSAASTEVIAGLLQPMKTDIAQIGTDIQDLKQRGNSDPTGNLPAAGSGEAEATNQAVRSNLQEIAAAIAITQTAVAEEQAALAARSATVAQAAEANQAQEAALQSTVEAISAAQTALDNQSTTSNQTMAHAQATATALVAAADANKLLTETRAQGTATALVGTATALVRNAASRATSIANTATGAGNPPAVAATATPIPPPPTHTPVAAAGQFAITFPKETTDLYVAPWQVEVTVQKWLDSATQYRLLLDSVELKRFSAPADGALTSIVYERAFVDSGLFDSFPDLDAGEAATLQLDTNKQLPAGEHSFVLQAQVAGNWADVANRTFAITTAAPPQGTLSTQSNIRRRMVPIDDVPGSLIDSNTGLPATYTQPVRLLGQTAGFYKDPTIPNAQRGPVEWILWETTDNNPRRGWAPARFFTFQDDKTIADVPSIAPPQSK